MHVLMTTDTVGGVWTYTQELVTGLIRRGVRVTLVSFGALPKPGQVPWMSELAGLDYRPTDYRLEWMEVARRDVEESRAYLEMVVREVQPDLLHLNQYAYGDVAPEIPRLVVAHSDVVSWWVAVHGHEPEESPWMRWYRDTVTRGLSHADLVVSPSQWMLEQVQAYYTRPGCGQVIYNGRDSRLFDGASAKQACVVSVGRMWDEGKQMSLLLAAESPVPVFLVGSLDHPGGAPVPLEGRASSRVRFLGEISQGQLRQLLAGAAIYAATSRYEPFGLAPVEAALSRCALIANDTPTFHELWGDSAWYFRHHDPRDLSASIRCLAQSPTLRERYGERARQTACMKYTSEKMVDQYELAYEALMPAARLA